MRIYFHKEPCKTNIFAAQVFPLSIFYKAVCKVYRKLKVISKPITCIYHMLDTEAALQRCSWEKLFRKYAANLQENTHVEV